MKKISVLGAGSWGTALAMLLDENGHEVTIWSIDEKEVEMLSKEREQKDKLPGIRLSERIQVTNSLEEAMKGRDILVFAVPSVFVRSTARSVAPYYEKGQIIIDVAKGIEEKTLMRLSEIIEDEIPGSIVCVLSGPSHAEEVARRIPTTVVIGAEDHSMAKDLQHVFSNGWFRVYTSPDILGIELGGALKNVIALAAGICDGLEYGDNTKAALITRGIAELSRLGVAMGGKPETFSGLSGIGDLIVTCTSSHSRNHNAGVLMGQGKTMQEAMDAVKMVVEGVYSAKAALLLATKYNVEIPIIEQVNEVLFYNKSAKDAVSDLFLRDAKREHEDLSWH
ncbi:MAG: NAD(P)H-dependent glycerol-3-phosphate dehydrogenase [Lachnospiraceae bacterium]|nr:NAD(P)H-dependent glycerol-3-phosphate dehydrogenase [Lachnospiraceae bacterium]